MKTSCMRKLKLSRQNTWILSRKSFKKDRSLQILLSNKADLPEKFLDDSKINEQIERVLQLQQRNADSFKKFFDERSRKEKGLEEKLSSGDQRLRKIYLNPDR